LPSITKIRCDNPPDIAIDVGGAVVTELPDEKVEELGVGLMHLEDAMAELRKHFGLEPGDLNIDLGPLGELLRD
jgi:hypothetical protein